MLAHSDMNAAELSPSMIISVGILSFELLFAWLSPAAPIVMSPPGLSPSYRYFEHCMVIGAMSVLPCCAGRLWYRASVFFCFGSLAAFPLAIDLFFPLPQDSERRTGLSAEQILAPLSFCLAAGIITALLGFFLSHAHNRNTRNA